MLCKRRQDYQNHYFDFLTNNFEIEAEDSAFLYKERWGKEILFKKMKQSRLLLGFQLHYFKGENEMQSIHRSGAN